MRHKFKRGDIASSVSRLWGHGETISEFYLEHIAQEYFDLQQKHAPFNPFVIQSLNLYCDLFISIQQEVTLRLEYL